MVNSVAFCNGGAGLQAKIEPEDCILRSIDMLIWNKRKWHKACQHGYAQQLGSYIKYSYLYLLKFMYVCMFVCIPDAMTRPAGGVGDVNIGGSR